MAKEIEKAAEATTEVAVRPSQGLTFADLERPAASIQRVAELATALNNVIEAKNMFTEIKGRKHIHVEAWTMLGSMTGVFAVLVDCEPCVLPDKKDDTKFHKGFTAFVEARTLDGKVVGAARSYCMRNENTWAPRDDYAVASMAQTRATSKALRQPLGFIVKMAGYDATPYEEMPQSLGSRRIDRMLARVGQLCIEIDKIREVEQGTTWGIAEQESQAEFDRPIDQLGEDDMAVLGTALSRYAEEVKTSPERMFQIFGGDEIFAGDNY